MGFKDNYRLDWGEVRREDSWEVKVSGARGLTMNGRVVAKGGKNLRHTCTRKRPLSRVREGRRQNRWRNGVCDWN